MKDKLDALELFIDYERSLWSEARGMKKA